MEFDSKEEERAEYKRAYANVKRQIHKLGRTTISPQSKFLGRWDFATATAMLWTAFVTPFQIGFLEPIESPSSALSILNRLVDVVFLADMAITFFVPYRESPHRGGMWTFDNKKIAKRCKLEGSHTRQPLLRLTVGQHSSPVHDRFDLMVSAGFIHQRSFGLDHDRLSASNLKQ